MIQKVCTLHSAAAPSVIQSSRKLIFWYVYRSEKNRNETNSSYHQFDNYWGIGLIQCLMAIHREPPAFQYPSANENTKLNSEYFKYTLPGDKK